MRGSEISATYESDVVAWANEQATLLRSGDLSALDIEHIADEVEVVGKGEKRELGQPRGRTFGAPP